MGKISHSSSTFAKPVTMLLANVCVFFTLLIGVQPLAMLVFPHHQHHLDKDTQAFLDSLSPAERTAVRRVAVDGTMKKSVLGERLKALAAKLPEERKVRLFPSGI